MRAAWQMPLHDHDARLCARKAEALADVVLECVGVFLTWTLVPWTRAFFCSWGGQRWVTVLHFRRTTSGFLAIQHHGVRQTLLASGNFWRGQRRNIQDLVCIFCDNRGIRTWIQRFCWLAILRKAVFELDRASPALPFGLDSRKASSSLFPCEKVFQTTLASSLPRVGFSLLKSGAVRGRRVLILLTNAGCPTHADVDPPVVLLQPPGWSPQSFPEAKSCCDRFGYINQNHFFSKWGHSRHLQATGEHGFDEQR